MPLRGITNTHLVRVSKWGLLIFMPANESKNQFAGKLSFNSISGMMP
jgi:hypothetical protein